MIKPDDAQASILVAVSGGPDSVALFWALRELSGHLGFSLAAAHLDHGLRGIEGAGDRAFVEELARAASVHCVTDRANLTTAKGNMEAAARRERYHFLYRAARLAGCNRVATGHTLDDQAETVMMRIIAGAGSQGLAGIAPVRGSLIRPLLECSRRDVWHFLRSTKSQWRRDRTNYDLGFARNRLRHLVLPFLAGTFNRHLNQGLARLAELARCDNELLEKICQEAERAVLGESMSLQVAKLLELPLSLQRRIIRRWLASHGAKRPSADQVEQVRVIATESGPARTACLGGVTVTCELGILSAGGTHEASRAGRYSYTAGFGSEIRLSEARMIGSISVPQELSKAPEPSNEVCVADAALLPPLLTIRNRRAGDRIFPLGMSGSKELKEVYRQARIPRHKRSVLPLVLAGGEILWIPGVARSRFALVSASTRRVVVGRVRRE